MKGIPMIPMLKVLRRFAFDHNIPLKITNWESIKKCLIRYQMYVDRKN